MSAIFNVSEILRAAILIEENGYKFYSQVANESRFYELKEFAKFLASEEKSHIEIFKKMFEDLPKYEIQEAYPGEYGLYLKALADDHVFTYSKDPVKLAREFKTSREIVDFGIQIEKDSIIFYEGLRETVLRNELPAITEVIKQERNHLFKLLDFKQNTSEN